MAVVYYVFVYILASSNSNKLYTGYTSNLKERLAAHKSGSVYTTRRMGEVTLIYYEAFKSESDARRREGYLKTTKGERTLKLVLKNSLYAPIV